MPIDKSELIAEITEILLNELQKLQSIAASAASAATEKGLVAEGKYDTRAIESSYLAGGQAKRVEELKVEIAALSRLANSGGGKVSLGSLVAVEIEGEESLFFLLPVSGMSLMHANQKITVVSPQSPIGSSLAHLECGDSFEFESPSGTRSLEIITIF
ncbi:MAG: hypothetical protein HN509_10945 [Halobacteriovoraceae bacterium]|jgi:transcription elongation GreA/GreB family factor|nr:hypothetical protein [Halobacteriovoraceae bacterium]MBT5096106.1 hypothetical protein [Halobacteriovoraceae bacterium]